jgi:RNA polymerase sigma-70 factor (ECF subfamily)
MMQRDARRKQHTTTARGGLPLRGRPTRAGGAAGDAGIKELARKDRMAAMDLVVQRYGARLERHARGIVKDAQEARDAVQEVFIKAMREKRFFQVDFEIRAWLFRVTTNLCYNVVRDKRRRGNILANMDEALVPQSRSPETRHAVYTDQLRGELMAAMQLLSEPHREILMLRFYRDLSYREISETLDIRLGTVMSRLSRAKGRLGEVMGPDHPLLQQAP